MSPPCRISSAARSRSRHASGRARVPLGMCVSEMTAIFMTKGPGTVALRMLPEGCVDCRGPSYFLLTGFAAPLPPFFPVVVIGGFPLAGGVLPLAGGVFPLAGAVFFLGAVANFLAGFVVGLAFDPGAADGDQSFAAPVGQVETLAISLFTTCADCLATQPSWKSPLCQAPRSLWSRSLKMLTFVIEASHCVASIICLYHWAW